MCLGIPGQITSLNTDGLLPQGEVDFGGTRREVCLAYTPDAGVGDWVLVHVGFAISQMSEDEAQRTLADLQTLAETGEAHELGGRLADADADAGGATIGDPPPPRPEAGS